jgi:hypothetical protein
VVGLEHGRPSGVEAPAVPEPARAEQHAAHVGEHVAEEVGCDDHVEAAGISNQPVGGEVDVDRFPRDARLAGGLVRAIAPQTADRGYPGLLQDHRQLPAPALSQLGGDVDDPLDLAPAVGERMLGDVALAAGVGLAPAPLVDARGLLADDHDVHVAECPRPDRALDVVDLRRGPERVDPAEEVEAAAQLVHPPAAMCSDQHHASTGERVAAELGDGAREG